MNRTKKTLLCFGFGLCAAELAKILAADWEVIGTHRDRSPLFNDHHPLDEAVIKRASHVLLSIPPSENGDPSLRLHGAALASSPRLQWAGYLSTVGIYGDCYGEAVDESRSPNPTSPQSKRRLAAERAWGELFAPTAVAFHIFRLAGIYGVGRSALVRCLNGTAERVIGHPLCRIHAEDVAQTLKASIAKPRNRAIYNVADDQPTPTAEVVEYACRLLGLPPPPKRDWRQLPPHRLRVVRRFYTECRRLTNGLIKNELGVRLKYPNYKSGLEALASAIKADAAAANRVKS